MATPLIIVYAILLSPAAFAFGVVILAAASLTVDAWRCRHPSAELVKRLDAYPPSRIADEAQSWLDRQYPL